MEFTNSFNIITEQPQQNIKFDKEMMAKLSNIIKGPKIDVLAYTDKSFINAYTYTLSFDNREDFLNSKDNSIIFLTLKTFKDALTGNLPNVETEIHNGKAIMHGIPYIPIMYERTLLEFKSNELLAVLLHECGHHTVFYKNIVHQLGFSTIQLTNLILFLNFVLRMFGMGIFYFTSLHQFYLFLAIHRTILFLYSKILCQPLEYNADNFAKQLGYGEDLASALFKLNRMFNADLKTPIIAKLTMLFFGAILSHPDTYDRIKELVENPDEFIKQSKKDVKRKNIISFIEKLKTFL